jgi:hypothetical protein
MREEKVVDVRVSLWWAILGNWNMQQKIKKDVE